ncbi:hypothetical protein D3C81_365110 [compost metagenome]
MPFQSTVGFRYTQGFLGQVTLEVPSVVKPWRLSAQTAQANTFGKAFTWQAEVAPTKGLQAIEVAQVGLSAAGVKFAGILCHPEMMALNGTAAGTLSPTLDVAANEVVQLMAKGEVVVSFTTAVAYGDPVYFDNVTGALFNTADAARTLIDGARVTNPTGAAGLTTISLG